MAKLRTSLTIQFKVLIYADPELSESDIQDSLNFEMSDFDSSFANLNSDDLDIAFASYEFSSTTIESLDYYGVDEIQGFEFKRGTISVQIVFETDVEHSVDGEKFYQDLNFGWEPLYSDNEGVEVIDCQSDIAEGNTFLA